jgi:hypothetical protein
MNAEPLPSSIESTAGAVAVGRASRCCPLLTRATQVVTVPVSGPGTYLDNRAHPQDTIFCTRMKRATSDSEAKERRDGD